MSWSLYKIVGRPASVIEKVHETLAQQKCSEPEESIKKQAEALIEFAVAHMPPNQPVMINASGSQSADTTGAANNFSLTIEPLWGFLE